MGTVGELYEKKTALMQERARVQKRIDEIKQTLKEILAILDKPGTGRFDRVNYPIEHLHSIQYQANPDRLNATPEELRSLHLRYVELTMEITETEKALKHAEQQL